MDMPVKKELSVIVKVPFSCHLPIGYFSCPPSYVFAISVEPVEIVGFGVRLVLNFVTETRAVRSSLQSFERYSGYLLGDTDDRVQRVQVPIFRVLGVLRIVDTFDPDAKGSANRDNRAEPSRPNRAKTPKARFCCWVNDVKLHCLKIIDVTMTSSYFR